MEPTEEQEKIINCDGNIVVLAAPGSGKTFVLSEKIKKTLKKEELLDYNGVAALSFTRKASNNLKKRTLAYGLPKKNSFFGTIDSFCLTQIIFPFGYSLLGYPSKELEILNLDTAKKEEINSYIKSQTSLRKILNADLTIFRKLFQEGYISINSIEYLALRIIYHCRRYLKARFKYIFVDEYQDVDQIFHNIFLKILNLGLRGMVVGDIDQSIYGFANKSSKYLLELTNLDQFNTFRLTTNFRSHPSIVEYANKLLRENFKINNKEKRVCFFRVEGDERTIAAFIDRYVNALCKKFEVKNLNDVAILVKNDQTLKLIDSALKTSHRKIVTTELEKDINPRSQLYALLLRYFYDNSLNFQSIIEKFVEYELLSILKRTELNEVKRTIVRIPNTDPSLLVVSFQKISEILFSNLPEGNSKKILLKTLSNPDELASYRPIANNEIQLMTLHKSKGLEFDVVFHLNLDDWVLPAKKPTGYINMEQDLNLHYVGITRARKFCALLSSTQRTRNGLSISSAPSEFLYRNRLERQRKNFKVDRNLTASSMRAS
ncbi:MAG: UvrD-helicase domain-containing protein [Parasutterella excrementihominis]|uniref:UvrD-helicase domain-containing protein n=1 Tax=Parasutterella excrementihominis TaxID=487175 RepID=UPI0039A12F9C